MVAIKISGRRPALIADVMAARDHEIDKLQLEEEIPGNEYRLDLLEFATHCLLAEVCGFRLAQEPHRTPFLVMLAHLTDKYHNSVLCRRLFALAKEGAPL